MSKFSIHDLVLAGSDKDPGTRSFHSMTCRDSNSANKQDSTQYNLAAEEADELLKRD